NARGSGVGAQRRWHDEPAGGAAWSGGVADQRPGLLRVAGIRRHGRGRGVFFVAATVWHPRTARRLKGGGLVMAGAPAGSVGGRGGVVRPGAALALSAAGVAIARGAGKSTPSEVEAGVVQLDRERAVQVAFG